MITWYDIKYCDFPDILMSHIFLLCKVRIEHNIPFFITIKWDGKQKRILELKEGKENWIDLPKEIEILKWSYIDNSNC